MELEQKVTRRQGDSKRRYGKVLAHYPKAMDLEAIENYLLRGGEGASSRVMSRWTGRYALKRKVLSFPADYS